VEAVGEVELEESRLCPACGRACSGDFLFCPGCGAQLDAGGGRPEGGLPEERKTVTLLFCDIVGFTAMSEACDPEDVDGVLREYSARARRAIEAHGGIVEKFIGDAAVGVFGVPAAHEDDAERAVRAALRILETLKGMERPDGTPLQARCGVNTGEVLARLDVDPASGSGFLSGDAVNTAARLQAAAPPEGVAAGELTYELTRRAIVYDELPRIAAKGKAEPVRAWRAVRAVSRTGLRTAGESAARMVGRDEELRLLLDEFDAAAGSRRSRGVLLVGEPGAGKSRLVLELAAALEARPDLVTWRVGRCLPYGDGVSLAALAELVKAQAGVSDSDDAATAEAKLAALGTAMTCDPWVVQRLRPLLGLPAPEASQEESFAAWTVFLTSLAGDHAAVVVVEDLHWADPVTLDLLEHVVSEERAVPLLLVATTRQELDERRQGSLSARMREVRLSPLAEADAGALVTALLGGRASPAVAEAIAAGVGGNPLFAEEYVRHVLEGDGPVPDGASQDLTLRSPGSVQAVIAARLDALPAGHKAVLMRASVLGETFWDGGVTALCGASVDEVAAVLETLAERRLVRPATTSSLAGEREYVFWHALTRDVAYGQLTRAARARAHAAAASWVEARTAGSPEELAEVVAHHYTAALDLARATRDADLTASLRTPALRSLRLAGARARRLDLVAAERNFRAALELAEPASLERYLVLSDLAAVAQTDTVPELEALAREAYEGLRRLGAYPEATRAVVPLTRALAAQGRLAETLALCSECVGFFEGEGPSRAYADALDFLGGMGFGYLELRPRLDEFIALEERAIAMYEELGVPVPARALGYRAVLRCFVGDAGGFDDFVSAEVAAEQRDESEELALLLYNHGGMLWEYAGTAEALVLYRRLAELAEARGLPGWRDAARNQLFLGGLMETPDAEMDQTADELAGGLEASGDLWGALLVRTFHVDELVRRGRAGDARRFLPLLEGHGADEGLSQLVPNAFVAAAATRAALGEAPRALELLAQALAVPSVRVTGDYAQVLADIVRLCLALGESGLAQTLVEGVPTLLPVQSHALASAQALLAEMRGGHEVAAAGFADAATRWHDFAVPYEEGQALLGQGRCLVALGRAPEAAAHLAAAREIFARLGAKPALAETEAWLARASAGGATRPSAPADLETGGAA
jgi:class 3 adenylate cyclase